MSYSRPIAILLASSWLSSCATTTEQSPTAQWHAPGAIGKVSGSGSFPAQAVAVASMPQNTLYYPQQSTGQKLPLVLWGNGGCRDNGLRYSQFLREVASHGFFIIASGHPRFERELQPPGSPPVDRQEEETPDTTVDDILAGIDWAESQTADPESPYYQRIDTDRIGVMGTSCGGLQAITILGDPRVDTGIAFNSGVLTAPPPGPMKRNRNLHMDKTLLQGLQGPIAYINGGPSDIAYVNALDDLSLIEHVPVFFGENGVGHGGTYLFDEKGGDYGEVATQWMAWQLQKDADAADWFVGEDCVLCTKDGWQVQKKGMQ